jgi:hypothetical protein
MAIRTQEIAMNAQTETLSINIPTDDTLCYKVNASRVIPRGEVTVVAQMIVVVKTQTSDNTGLDQRINAALQAFLPTEWESLGYERSSLTTGYEQVKVQAIAKVPAEENHNLEERARRANSDGLEFGEITVKRSLPADQVGQIVKEMWFDIIGKVNLHITEFERTSGRKWRIGNINYGVPDAGRRQESRKGSFRDEIDDVLGGLADVGLAGAEKISLIAEVTLKSPRP